MYALSILLWANHNISLEHHHAFNLGYTYGGIICLANLQYIQVHIYARHICGHHGKNSVGAFKGLHKKPNVRQLSDRRFCSELFNGLRFKRIAAYNSQMMPFADQLLRQWPAYISQGTCKYDVHIIKIYLMNDEQN